MNKKEYGTQLKLLDTTREKYEKKRVWKAILDMRCVEL